MYNSEKNSGNLAESPRVKKMLAIVDGLNPRDWNILDIGCHDGTFLSLVKNRDNRFFGVDASDWAVNEARRKGLDAQEFFFDDKTPLLFEDSHFELVIAGEIIEHIFDTDFFLEEIRRILKPGGKLLISTPNIASLGRRLLLLFGRNPLIELSPNDPESVGHIRYFTFKTLKIMLKKHKFDLINSQSDVVNFFSDGKIRSAILANLFPKLGASVICLAKNLIKNTPS